MAPWFHALFFLSLFDSVASIPSALLGIDPRERAYYHQDVIMCKDGSHSFKRQQLNDNYCDCVDGTDEPGTSACVEGKFHCSSIGHGFVCSSKVNDGICDCCDGSDEYDGKVRCPHTCGNGEKAMTENNMTKFQVETERVNAASLQDKRTLRHIIHKLKDLKMLLLLEVILSLLVCLKICFHKKKGYHRPRLSSYYHP